MTLEEAKAIMAQLEKTGEYFDLDQNSDGQIVLDGHFTADQLEAMAIVMRASGSASSALEG